MELSEPDSIFTNSLNNIKDSSSLASNKQESDENANTQEKGLKIIFSDVKEINLDNLIDPKELLIEYKNKY